MRQNNHLLEEIAFWNKVIKWSIFIVTALILLNIIDELIGHPSWQIERLINVGLEGNFPTWFSSMLLAIAAFLAYRCAIIVKEGRSLWGLLSLGLLFMSCDEVAQIHENLGNVLNKYLFRSSGIEHSAWVITLGPFVLLAFVIFAIKFKKYLRGSYKAMRALIIGAIVYIFGAFILESTINLLNHGNLEWLWKIENILEEACELFGAIVILIGLNKHHEFLSSAPARIL